MRKISWLPRGCQTNIHKISPLYIRVALGAHHHKLCQVYYNRDMTVTAWTIGFCQPDDTTLRESVWLDNEKCKNGRLVIFYSVAQTRFVTLRKSSSQDSVVVEALAGLLAEPASINHLGQKNRGSVLGVTKLVVQDAHDCETCVKTNKVCKLQRTHGYVCTILHDSVNVLF
jgi:hypothetical protein